MFDKIINATLSIILFIYTKKCLPLEGLATFPGMFEDIPQNVWQHSPECLATFPWMSGDIPWNV